MITQKAWERFACRIDCTRRELCFILYLRLYKSVQINFLEGSRNIIWSTRGDPLIFTARETLTPPRTLMRMHYYRTRAMIFYVSARRVSWRAIRIEHTRRHVTTTSLYDSGAEVLNCCLTHLLQAVVKQLCWTVCPAALAWTAVRSGWIARDSPNGGAEESATCNSRMFFSPISPYGRRSRWVQQSCITDYL